MPLEASRTMASPGARWSPSDSRSFGLTMPVQAAARSIRPASTMPARAGFRRRPRHLADLAGPLPALDQGLAATGVGEPLGAAGGPVGLHHERRGADGDQVVDRHRDRVLGDRGVVAPAGQRLHCVGDHRLGAEALDDACQVERADVDGRRRFAARALDLGEAVRVEMAAGRGRGALRGDLERIDDVVVDPGAA
jgi:hypothetical protein